MSPSRAPSPLHLFLADEHGPALPEGLDANSLDRAPQPEGARRVLHLWSEEGTNDLAKQRWAVIYPRDRADLLDAIGPLLRRRAQQQGVDPLRFALAPDDDGAALRRELYDGRLAIADQPRYLLILGDLDQVSAEVQLRLGSTAAVGRLAFDRPEDYRSYAEKVVAWEERAQTGAPRLLLYGAYDPYDGAMRAGEADLLVEVDRLAGASGVPVSSFGRTLQSSQEGLRALLASAEAEAPTLLLTVSHGLGSGRWSPDERRARHGALRIDRALALEAEHLRERPFLPGGLWACFACFSAGTPTRSRFDLWLKDLAAQGAMGGAPNVLATLSTDRPFVAALPRAALANPQGPLGVLGHVDLAWGWSFRDEARGGETRAVRFASLLDSAARGDRFGLGLGPLARARIGAGHMLAEYAEKAQQGALTPEDLRARGHDWMTWHDLGAWILLGDPAARLPLPAPRALSWADLLPQPVPSPSPAHPAPVRATPADPDAVTLERLVLAKLAGEPDARARAEAAGVSWTELRRLEQIYTDAGRRALEAARR